MARNRIGERKFEARLRARRRAGAALAALLTGAAPIAVAWPADARAQTSEAIEFDIPQQPIASALVAFARQARVQLVMSEEPSGGVNANAVRGALDRERALAILLEGTGYQARFENGAIRLRRTSASASDQQRQGALDDRELVQLAQADSGQGIANDGSEVRDRRRRESNPDEETVVVVGTNIRGVYPASSPVDIYTAEDIARTGATTTEQFIQKLPQNLGTRTAYSLNATAFRNLEAVNSVDLRGLGVGTTLTLLNGRRIALGSFGQSADVSMLPLGAIERVEVLSDGASAIYGSDAIGGVVNFVLREDYDGAESRIRYGGVTSGGLRQGGVSQTVGRNWTSGQGLVSLDFFSASALDRSDRDYVTAAEGLLTPVDQRVSALASFEQEFGDRLSIDGHFVYSSREIKTFEVDDSNQTFLVFVPGQSESEQRLASFDITYDVGAGLEASLRASYSDIDVSSGDQLIFPDFGLTIDENRDTKYSGLDISGILSGRLFSLLGGQARFSVGAGHFDEQYRPASTISGATSGWDLGRGTNYAFAEIWAPLVQPQQGIAFIHRLELSVAGRYTSYTDESDPALDVDFGNRTSPKVGVLWGLTPSFNFRATYGESFRAPTLAELDPTSRIGALDQPSSVAGVPSTVFRVLGPSPQLEPETAQSYTIGFDLQPPAIPGLRIAGTYFNIDYIDRLAAITNSVAPRANPADFPDLIFRPSSSAEIEELLRLTRVSPNRTGINLSDPAAASSALFAIPEFWIFDGRLRNLTLSQVDGLDLSVESVFEAAWAQFVVGGQLTRIFDYREQATPSSAVQTVVDTVLRPVDLRARAFVSVNRGGFDATLSLNYLDDYSNPFAASGPQHVESWTIVDLAATYDFGSQGAGVRVGLSVQNLFDEDPPYVQSSGSNGLAVRRELGFDPANANPLGRLISIELIKAW